MKGFISSIESYTVHDGPGCRTTVFMGGCPLRCQWCANPETWKAEPKLMFYPGKCDYDTGCRRCIEKSGCAGLIEKEGKIAIDWDKCRDCKEISCAATCKKEALKKSGSYFELSDLMKVLDRDRPFWDEEGGVTFSGGEPFFQHDFLKEILLACKEEHIHTAIETSAYVSSEVFLDIVPLLDFMFIDLKHMDPEKHKEKTGVENGPILENIKLLAEKKAKDEWQGRVVIRMPVIEGFNDTEDNIIQMAGFMKENGLTEANILPFHNLGTSKWTQLGKEYVYEKYKATEEQKLKDLQEIFEALGITCYIGSDTAF